MSRIQRALLAVTSLFVAGAMWIPCLHGFFMPRLGDYVRPQGIAPKVRALAARHLELWISPQLREQEVNRMRASNAEWDFMGRTFFVLALANMGLREPKAKNKYVEVMDQVIEETLRLEREKGLYFFLMDYARKTEFVSKPARSLFLDGEIALMLAARRILEEREDFGMFHRKRVETMIEYMSKSPVLSGESYPDECWTFCNTVALSAIKMHDVLDRQDHSDFLKRWVETAKRKLVDPKTGLLISSYTFEGDSGKGPEGSSIWMAAHCLKVIDEEFAKDQYQRARKELARKICGFGYAAEWPKSWRGPMDIDSGPVVPWLELSAASSGMAMLGASTFEDSEYLSALLASLNFGGFPDERLGTLKYCASNQVGDAVLLYALVQGPLWQKIERQVTDEQANR